MSEKKKSTTRFRICCNDMTCGCVREIEEVTLRCPECGASASFEVAVHESTQAPSMPEYDSRDDKK